MKRPKPILIALFLLVAVVVAPCCISGGKFDPEATAVQLHAVAGTALDASFVVEDEELAEDLAEVAATLSVVADSLEGGSVDGGALAGAMNVTDALLARDDLTDEIKLAVVGARFALRQVAAASKAQATETP